MKRARISLPTVTSRYGLHSLSFLGADRWNALPATFRATPSHTLFRYSILDWAGYPVRRRKSVGTALEEK